MCQDALPALALSADTLSHTRRTPTIQSLRLNVVPAIMPAGLSATGQQGVADD